MKDERAEAMARLGAPIVICANCDATAVKVDVYFVAFEREGQIVEPVQHFCSLACIRDWPKLLLSVQSKAYRRGKGEWNWGQAYNIGHFSPLLGEWVWNDTGESIWIDENMSLLRATGEIS